MVRMDVLATPVPGQNSTIEEFVELAKKNLAGPHPQAVRSGATQLRLAATLVQARAAELAAQQRFLGDHQAHLEAEWQLENPEVPLTDAVRSRIPGWRANRRTLEQLTEAQKGAAAQVDLLAKLADEAEFNAPAALSPDMVAGQNAAKLLEQAQVQLHHAIDERKGSGGDVGAAAADAAIGDLQARLADAIFPPGSPARPLRVQMKRADVPDTEDTALWFKIRRATIDLGWDKYALFMDNVLGGAGRNGQVPSLMGNSKIQLPFPDADAYRFLKAATEVFMMVGCSTFDEVFRRQVSLTGGPLRSTDPQLDTGQDVSDDLAYGQRRLGPTFTEIQIEKAWSGLGGQGGYLKDAGLLDGTSVKVLPYLALIRGKLQDQSIVGQAQGPAAAQAHAETVGILSLKLSQPCLLELIWSYWQEEGMLVQTMNALSRRFQNIRAPGDRDPLAAIEIDPLRPLNNFLWGWIQDEQHRLTVVRRAYEYDHHYGLALVGKAVPQVRGADSRTRFLEAFHNLLHVTTLFYKEDDDTTVIADGFPVLNALRDVHIILSQGAHNQFGDLPWTARQEMLMQQWLLARPEMREFLPTRVMVAYPEPWMDRVDAMKTLMGWTDTSAMHFRELAIYGERLLLGARFNDWSRVIEPERASNWARFWRPEVQGYVHAYRAATGVDLSERAEATMPSSLLRARLAAQRVAAR